MIEPVASPDFAFAFRPGRRWWAIMGLGGLGAIFLCVDVGSVGQRLNQGKPVAEHLGFLAIMGGAGILLTGLALYTGFMLKRSCGDGDVYSARAHAAFYAATSIVWVAFGLVVATSHAAKDALAAAAFCGFLALFSLWGVWVWGRWLLVIAKRDGPGLLI